MPAAILTGPPAVLDSAAASAAAGASPAAPLPFDSLLAAALAGAVHGPAVAVPVLPATAASPAEDQGEGSTPSDRPVLELAAIPAPLPDSLLSTIVPPAAALRAVAAVGDSARADAGGIAAANLDGGAAAGPKVAQAPPAPAFAARAEPALRQSAPGPLLPSSEPARIAAPATASTPAAAPDAAAVPAGLPPASTEPRTPADSAPLPAPAVADVAPSAATLASDRPDPGVRASGQPVRMDIAVPLGSREFGAELGNRLVWMATNRHQVAELRIDPPQLGPVELRLSIASDQASLAISSPHAAVRDAIQASLPRLQDMLQGLGINLGSVSVGAEAFGQSRFAHPQYTQHTGESGHAPAAYPVAPPAGTSGLVVLPAVGVIDVYV